MISNQRASEKPAAGASAESHLVLAAALIRGARTERPGISDEDLFVSLAHAAAAIYGPGALRTWLGAE